MYSHGKTDGVFRCSGATVLKKLDKDEKKLVAAIERLSAAVGCGVVSGECPRWSNRDQGLTVSLVNSSSGV
jgi:hypothetical protein